MDLNRKNIIFFIDRICDRRLEKIAEVKEIAIAPSLKASWETQPATTVKQPFKQKPSTSIIKGKEITFLLAFPLLLLMMGFIVKMGCQKISTNNLIFNKNRFKIACRQCKFFDNNQYLKCAVHPDKVLKKEARNCRDREATSNIENPN